MKAYRSVWSVAVVMVLLALAAGPALAQDNVPPGASKRPAYYVEFNGASSAINAGADASLADLHSGTFTVDGWIRRHSPYTAANIVYKGNDSYPLRGWWFLSDYEGGLTAYVFLDGSNDAAYAYAYNMALTANDWHHVVMTYDAATGLIWFAADGVWYSDIGWQHAATGPAATDVDLPLLMGIYPRTGESLDGDISWLRITRGARYVIGAPFTPPDVRVAPRVDTATVELWEMDDGHGEVARAEVERANNGVLTDATWVRWPK